MADTCDFIVVGAASGARAVAHGPAKRADARNPVVEARPSDRRSPDRAKAEAAILPRADAHPLTASFASAFPRDEPDARSGPDWESAGVVAVNVNGRRGPRRRVWLCPTMEAGRVQPPSRGQVRYPHVSATRAGGVRSCDGTVPLRRDGAIPAAGSIGFPARVTAPRPGPADDLGAAGIEVVLDRPEHRRALDDDRIGGLRVGRPRQGPRHGRQGATARPLEERRE